MSYFNLLWRQRVIYKEWYILATVVYYITLNKVSSPLFESKTCNAFSIMLLKAPKNISFNYTFAGKLGYFLLSDSLIWITFSHALQTQKLNLLSSMNRSDGNKANSSLKKDLIGTGKRGNHQEMDSSSCSWMCPNKNASIISTILPWEHF